MKVYSKTNLLMPALSLFTSTSTLLCCALPALLVTLGMGAVMAGLASNYPQLIWLSEHKNILFTFSAILLIGSGYMMYKARNLPCPVDAKQAKACDKLRKISLWIYGISVFIYLTGFFFAFIIIHLI